MPDSEATMQIVLGILALVAGFQVSSEALAVLLFLFAAGCLLPVAVVLVLALFAK